MKFITNAITALIILTPILFCAGENYYGFISLGALAWFVFLAPIFWFDSNPIKLDYPLSSHTTNYNEVHHHYNFTSYSEGTETSQMDSSGNQVVRRDIRRWN